ncbi:RIKEN cDNA 1110032A04, isoform CRA_a, partial [Mus musculus]
SPERRNNLHQIVQRKSITEYQAWILLHRQTFPSLRKSHGFQAREGVFCLALLSIPDHHLLCCHGALGTIDAQHHHTDHCGYGGIHCLCLHPHPHPPGLGIFLQNMWL